MRGSLASRGKDVRNRAVGGHDLTIGVDEIRLKDAPEALADPRLASGRRPDEHDRWPLLSTDQTVFSVCHE